MTNMDDERQNMVAEGLSFLKRLETDTRIPMNSIYGNIELISHESINENVRDSIQAIKSATDKITQIAAEAGSLVRICTNVLILNEREYCIEDVLFGVRRHLEINAEKYGITLKTDIDKKIPFRMFGDADRIMEMLRILICDTFEYCKGDKIEFKVRCMQGGSGSVALCFDISDNGDGTISDSIVRVLTDKGAYGEHECEEDGRALGIYIVKHMALKMSGKLSAKSQRGSGTTFTLVVAQKKIGEETLGDNENAEEERGIEEYVAFTAAGCKILILDKNIEEARMEAQLLHHYQITTDITDVLEDGIELLKRVNYDAVIVNNQPGCSCSIDTIRTIRSLADQPEVATDYLRTVPILDVISIEDEGIAYSIIQAGANELIKRPIVISELERVLKIWLSGDRFKYTPEYMEGVGGIGALEALGIDTQSALANFDGNEDEYKDVLMTLCRSGDTKVKMLQHYIDEHDYKSFIVAVHGILGVARVIGAYELAETSKQIERAAKQGVREIIEHETPRFMESFERLLSSIRSVIISADSVAPKGAIDKSDLISVITELRTYLMDYQIDKVEELFYTLAQFSYPNDKVMELIHQAEEQMLNYMYSDVIVTLNEITDILN